MKKFPKIILWILALGVLLIVKITDAKAADSDLEDGSYYIKVLLEGGSGRASVKSPAVLTVQGGEILAEIVWSSSNYDYMRMGDEKYFPVNTEGNSTFLIPVTEFDRKLPVAADTIAMSTPHEIEYTLEFDFSSISKEENGAFDENAGSKAGERSTEEAETKETETKETETKETALSGERRAVSGLTFDHSLELSYAKQFAVDYYEGGYEVLTIAESGRFLLVPENGEIPENLDEDIVVLQKPLTNIYLVATSAMDFFCALDRLDAIGLSGTDANGWYLEEAKEALENGSILFAGKYSAPDYERIVTADCSLALESTMIYHTPEVKEKLEKFGIPVMVERSSYESHPLGRTEWVKLYGALLDREEEAQQIFEEQKRRMESVLSEKNTEKTVAFFYITSNGYANVRKSNDYISNMIRLAGGNYVFDDPAEDETALSSVNMQMEEFYAGAKDADYIIYNSTIDSELETIDQLLAKSPLLKDFKAVKEGHVWCVGKKLFQQSTGLGVMIEDIHKMLTAEENSLTELTYMHRLQ